MVVDLEEQGSGRGVLEWMGVLRGSGAGWGGKEERGPIILPCSQTLQSKCSACVPAAMPAAGATDLL